MPKYTFTCENCHYTKQLNTSIKTKSIECTNCQSTMHRKLPKLAGHPDVNETVDKYTGATWKDGMRESVKERKDKYYWEVEVPRMVNSGTYSIETMLEMGWVYFNEKEELCVNNKPPSAR